jgi:hypothetical protein
MDYGYVIKNMQNAEVSVIANSGHFMMLDNPTDTYSVIGDCVARWTTQ